MNPNAYVTKDHLRRLLGRRPEPTERMREAACERCGRRIIFVAMAKSGRLMPCDPAWAYGDGRRTLIVQDEEMRGHVVTRAPEAVRGREAHWGTCPALKAERERRPQENPDTPTTHLWRVK